MRISFLLPGYPAIPIGGFRVVYQYANYFAEQNHHVTVIHAGRLRQHPVPRIPNNLKSWIALMKLWKSAYWPQPITWQFVDPRIQLVYLPGEPKTHLIPPADFIFATSWQTAEYIWEYPPDRGEKCHLIQHFQSWNTYKERIIETWRLPFHKIVIARWLLDMAHGMGLHDVVHIPNAIDHTQFYLTQPPESRPPSVLSLYHHFPWKGTEDALGALTRLHHERPEVSISFFGAEPHGGNLPSWVTYYANPSQDLLRELYNRHRIYVGASWAEGWALPPSEAMACGAVFVGTDNQGCLEYAQDGVNALLSPPHDLESLYHNILKIIDNSELATKLAYQGHKRLLSFTWENSGRALEQYLMKITAGIS